MVDFNSLNKHIEPSKSNGYIYFLMYMGELVYIGESRNMSKRLDSHKTNKVYDTVLYEFYENIGRKELRKREQELIKHYKPILCEQYKVKPDCRIKIIGDIMFSHLDKTCHTVIDNNIFLNGHKVGFIQDDNLYYFRYEYPTSYCPNWHEYTSHVVYYNFTTGVSSRQDASRRKIGREMYFFLECHEFDADSFRYVLKPQYVDVPSEHNVYKVGKYKGELKEKIKNDDPQYAKWFEENVERNKW